MGKRVTVTPYDEACADDFIKIRDEIKATLGDLALRIELKDMLALLKKRGYERASLAVQKANYAVRMYEKVGFRTVDENDEEFIMVCEL